MLKRRRFKLHPDSFKDRLATFAEESREKASLLPPWSERQDVLRKASHADTAAHIDGWLNSPGLQPPK
jgi:hypothetical protein